MQDVFFQITNPGRIYNGHIFPVRSLGKFAFSGKPSVCVVLPSGFMDFEQADGKFYTKNATGGLSPS